MASFTASRSERPRGHSRTRSGLGGANRRTRPSVVLSSIAAAAPKESRSQPRARAVPPPRGLKGAFISVENPLEAAMRSKATAPAQAGTSGKRAASGKFYYAKGRNDSAGGRGPPSKPPAARGAPPPHPKPRGSNLNSHKRGNSRHRIPPPRGLKGPYKNFANPLALAQERRDKAPAKKEKNTLADAAEQKAKHARKKSGRTAPPRPKSRAPGPLVLDVDPNSFGRIRGGSMSKAPTGRLAVPGNSNSSKKTSPGVSRRKRVNRLRMIKKQKSQRQAHAALLEEGWEAVKDAKGKEYYWNRETNETRWKNLRESRAR